MHNGEAERLGRIPRNGQRQQQEVRESRLAAGCALSQVASIEDQRAKLMALTKGARAVLESLGVAPLHERRDLRPRSDDLRLRLLQQRVVRCVPQRRQLLLDRCGAAVRAIAKVEQPQPPRMQRVATATSSALEAEPAACDQQRVAAQLQGGWAGATSRKNTQREG